MGTACAFVNAKLDQVVPIIGLVREDDDEASVFGAVGAELDLGQFNVFAEYARMDTDVSELKKKANALDERPASDR